MTGNINNKSNTTKIIRKAMLPIGIIVAVIGFVYVFLFTGAIATYGEGTEAAKKNMLDAARYMAIAFAFLALVLAGLVIAHAILQLVRLNKSNMKFELVSGIINAVVGLLTLVFFILVVTKVFTESEWYGEYSYKCTTFMGLLTALAVYLTAFARTFNNPSVEGKNTNIKMLRSIAVFAFVMGLCGIIATSLTCAGGFIDIQKITEAGKFNDWMSSSYAAKFAIAGFGAVALGLLCMIPLAILGIYDKKESKNQIVLWSVMGGVVFVLFIVAAAMMSLDQNMPKKWVVDAKNITITVFILLAEIMSIVGGAIAFAKTNQFAPRAAKVKHA